MMVARRIFYFFIFSNLFIACCAVLMAIQTAWLLLGASPDLTFLTFILSSTLCSYSFHWWLTPGDPEGSARSRWLFHHKRVHLWLFIIAAPFAGWSFLQLIRYWPWLIIGAIITFLYSAPKVPLPLFTFLRKIAVGKTTFLAFMWMYATTVLPVVVSGQHWPTGFLLFAAERFFLIFAICVIFDYRDRDYDKSTGIRSVVTLLQGRGISLIFAASLIFFAVLTLLLYDDPLPLKDIIILVIPGLITAMLYQFARRHFSDVLYYFVLDGLMALSALLLLITRLLAHTPW